MRATRSAQPGNRPMGDEAVLKLVPQQDKAVAPATAAGLRQVLTAFGAELRFNTRSSKVEARYAGGDWQPLTERPAGTAARENRRGVRRRARGPAGEAAAADVYRKPVAPGGQRAGSRPGSRPVHKIA